MKFGIYLCLCYGFTAAFAQTPQPAGVSSEWDVRKLLENLDLQTQHLKPIIEQVQPQKWVANGAPETYVAQWKTAQDQLRYLLSSSETLAKQPDRLTLARVSLDESRY